VRHIPRPLAGLACAAALLAACGGAGEGDGGDDGRLLVVAGFYPLAEAAARVGGDRVRVVDLTPAGTEPHDLELTSDEVDDIDDADVVLYLGQGFQPAVAEAAERWGDHPVDLLDAVEVRAGAAEALAEEEGGGDAGDARDPHVWLDPRRMSEMVGTVEEALADADPADADAFAAGADRYRADLEALDAEMAAGLADCARDEIVTSHAAFFYLADRYGLTQVPIAGLSPEAEPDPDRLADLADRVAEDGTTTVFTEPLASPEVAETLAREAGVDTAVLDPIEGLTGDEEAAGADYLSVMRENLAALRRALGCAGDGG